MKNDLNEIASCNESAKQEVKPVTETWLPINQTVWGGMIEKQSQNKPAKLCLFVRQILKADWIASSDNVSV